MKRPPSDGELDLDGDLDRGRGSRPVHLRWRYLGLVAVGGMVGTAARELVNLAVPSVGGVSVAILAINVLGAAALGVLLESLVRRGPDVGARRTLRLLLGTGVLGGFTTYSSLATDSAVFLTGGRIWVGVLYALGTLMLGAFATFAGITLAASAHRRRDRRVEHAGGVK